MLEIPSIDITERIVPLVFAYNFPDAQDLRRSKPKDDNVAVFYVFCKATDVRNLSFRTLVRAKLLYRTRKGPLHTRPIQNYVPFQAEVGINSVRIATCLLPKHPPIKIHYPPLLSFGFNVT